MVSTVTHYNSLEQRYFLGFIGITPPRHIVCIMTRHRIVATLYIEGAH